MRAGGGRCEQFGDMLLDVLNRKSKGVCVSKMYSKKYTHVYVIIGDPSKLEFCAVADAWLPKGYAGSWAGYGFKKGKKQELTSFITDGGESITFFQNSGKNPDPERIAYSQIQAHLKKAGHYGKIDNDSMYYV